MIVTRRSITIGAGALIFPALPLAAASPDFSKWWPQFQSAVARSDAHAVAQGAHFPMQWENGPIREINSQSDLINGFAKYLTPEIRKVIATKKPEKSGYGEYTVTWKARGDEYSLIFTPAGSTFVLNGLTEGPP